MFVFLCAVLITNYGWLLYYSLGVIYYILEFISNQFNGGDLKVASVPLNWH